MKSLKSKYFLFLLLSSFHGEIKILKVKSPFSFLLILLWNLYIPNKIFKGSEPSSHAPPKFRKLHENIPTATLYPEFY